VTSTAEVAEKYLHAMFAFDVTDLAPRVSCPTIVFHSRGDQLTAFAQGRKLAALIPEARFVPLDSGNHLPFREESAWRVLVTTLRPFVDADTGGRAPSPVKQLTPRQLDVLRGIARGLTDKEIAKELSLSPRTVEMHVARTLAALDGTNRAEAVAKAAALGLLD
jgi:DNA-binding CsgD family transcriptional regulator